MSEKEQRAIFSKNLKHYMSLSGHTQKEVADAIGVSPQTFNTWIKGIALPRMGKVERLVNFFGIKKSDLIDEAESAGYAIQLSSIESEIMNVIFKLTAENKKVLLKQAKFLLCEQEEEAKEKGNGSQSYKEA